MSVVNRSFRLASLRRASLASAVTLGTLASPLATSARAEDASFGCKVLLCAAATAPGWAAIPYCVPVMQELFRQLAARRPWPVCMEANASAPQPPATPQGGN